jgi:hypothetical protein
MRYHTFLIGTLALISIPALAQDMSPPTPITLPDARGVSAQSSIEDYQVDADQGRKTYTVERTNRGNTVDIPEGDVIKYCGDRDGCTLRIGLHNWDDTGRVASRDTLFFYNKRNHAWRVEVGDLAGTNNNNVTQHVLQAWSCYFTDGRYRNWVDQGDPDASFGLLSWNQYNADCFLTIVD